MVHFSEVPNYDIGSYFHTAIGPYRTNIMHMGKDLPSYVEDLNQIGFFCTPIQDLLHLIVGVSQQFFEIFSETKRKPA